MYIYIYIIYILYILYIKKKLRVKCEFNILNITIISVDRNTYHKSYDRRTMFVGCPSNFSVYSYYNSNINLLYYFKSNY